MSDIQQYAKNITVWNKQWELICDEMKKYGETTPHFEDIISETESSVAKVIQQGIFNNLNLITIPTSEIRHIWRFVKEKDTSKLVESRFIPQPEYASLNRMNDKDRLYSYFSISYKDSAGRDAIATGVKEIRATEEDEVWKCKFNFSTQETTLKIVDFSPVCRIPKDEKDYTKFLIRNIGKEYPINKDFLTYWLLQTLLQIFHESKMFAPIDKNENEDAQRLKYKPFHVICDYLERNGYHGIIYRSTVFPRGHCLTLFNPKYADCIFDTLEIVDISSALKTK